MGSHGVASSLVWVQFPIIPILKNKIVIAQPRESVCEKGCIIMLNKKDQIVALATKLSITQESAKVVYDAFVEMISEGIRESEKVRVGNLVTFEIVEQKERQGRNPKTGEPMTIPAKRKVKAKVSKGFEL